MLFPFPCLPPQFLTVILNTFSLPRIRVYPGAPRLFLETPQFCITWGCSATRLILHDPPCLSSPPPPQMLLHPTSTSRQRHFPFFQDASGTPWVIHRRYNNRGTSECRKSLGLGTEPPTSPGQAGGMALPVEEALPSIFRVLHKVKLFLDTYVKPFRSLCYFQDRV